MRRSMLFAPGSNPGNIINAASFGADSIILDLEDAVAYGEKDSARILVRNALSALSFGHSEVIVRVNALSTEFWRPDLDAIVPRKPDVIMTPKTERAEDVVAISGYIAEIERKNSLPIGGIKLIALLESPAGIRNAYEIAAADPRVDALYLGAEDLALELHAVRTLAGREILYARSQLIMAARCAGVQALDTPFILDIRDMDALREDCQLARELGFDGKASIYPGHVELINEAFTPSREKYEHALQVLAALEKAEKLGRGVATLNGKLIDAPIIQMAKRTISEYSVIPKSRQ
jgi:citrate lyase subunit beta/citryl-CoA lyase